MLVYFAGELAGSFVFNPEVLWVECSGGVCSLITAHVAIVALNWCEMHFPLAYVVGDLSLVSISGVGNVSHFCGALAGLLVGVLILRNISSIRTVRESCK